FFFFSGLPSSICGATLSSAGQRRASSCACRPGIALRGFARALRHFAWPSRLLPTATRSAPSRFRASFYSHRPAGVLPRSRAFARRCDRPCAPDPRSPSVDLASTPPWRTTWISRPCQPSADLSFTPHRRAGLLCGCHAHAHRLA
ncbi:hypothetical protein C8J57DRAFT_1713363, partial [Mycena rebaudengoi]